MSALRLRNSIPMVMCEPPRLTGLGWVFHQWSVVFTGSGSCPGPVTTCLGVGFCYLLGVFTLPNTRCLGERPNWLEPVKIQCDDDLCRVEPQ